MDSEKTEQEQDEALRLKTLAEQKYSSSNLKSALKYAKRAHRLHPRLGGLPEMLTALKILRVAAKSSSDGAPPPPPPDWYKVLQVEPFCHINTIKKQYKKLALTLHPDKNPFVASEEAFKLVGDAFRVLSDKIRRKEYDMKLRIALQLAAAEAAFGGDAAVAVAVETFWMACSTCRLLHQFERRYLGHNLMCPSCRKSFKAVEVSENVAGGGEEDRVQTGDSARVVVRNGERSRSVEAKRKMSSVREALERSKRKRIERSSNVDGNSNGAGGGVVEGLRSKSRRVEMLTIWDEKEERSRGVESERGKDGEEMMTLAEMQMLAKQKVNEDRMMLKLKERERDKEKEKEKE